MPPSALLRRAAAMKSASLDTYTGSTVPSIYGGDSHSNLYSMLPTSPTSTGGGGGVHFGPPTRSSVHPLLRGVSSGGGGRSFSTDTELDGLRNDHIEALLRSDTTDVLEEEIDDYFPPTEPTSTYSEPATAPNKLKKNITGGVGISSGSEIEANGSGGGRNSGKHLTASQTSLETSL